MTDSILSPEQIEQAKKVGEVITKMFVHHVDGNIVNISTKPNRDVNYLEVPISKVVDFLQGKKNYKDYSIEYFLTGGELEFNKTKDDEVNLKILYVLPKISDVSSVEMFVVHNLSKKTWDFNLTEKGKDFINSQNLKAQYHFFVTKRGDPHFLYRTMSFTGLELLDNPSIPFEKLIEHDEPAISITIVKKFNQCGYITND